MPIIKPLHVVSFSNAETNHPADNLLKPEGTFKWKVPGGKAATAVLQFEKATEIHSIDIGNEGSAFVEVLVGKSTSNSDQDYEVLLVASSFMTPVESRNGTNRNSVRMFGPDKLNKTVATQRWDRVKIVCTQPFNKTASYGLSFITFHSPPDAQEQKEKESGVKKIGAFTLKPESGDPISTGSMFEKKKAHLTGAAAVRAASKLAEESRGTPAKSEENIPVQKAVMPSEKPSTSLGGSKRKHAMSDDEEEKTPPPKPSMKKQSTSISSTASSLKGSEKPPLKKTKSDTTGQAKPFHKLMEGVVFVLSGYQNPFRAELRDMATEMGAVYKPDWKKGCTHLICAFQNTPKYNQVKGKGKIVKKEWIQHMYKQKKPLPWRKYRLGDADTPEGTSEEESDNECHTPAVKEPVKKSKPKEGSKTSPEKHASKGKSKKGVDFDGDTDSGGEEAPMDYGGDTDSGGDTEDELEKVKAKLASESKQSNPYGDSTDEDEPSKKSPKPSPPKNNSNQPSTSHQSKASKTAEDSDDSGLPDLPDYFTDKHFFLYGDFPSGERRLLTRYITAYNGEMEEYMNDEVHYVITNSDWDKNFDDALSDHPKLVFVKPKWIHTCHEKEKLVPYQHHIVIPKDD